MNIAMAKEIHTLVVTNPVQVSESLRQRRYFPFACFVIWVILFHTNFSLGRS